MAKQSKPSRRSAPGSAPASPEQPSESKTVSGRWLVEAILATVLVAALAIYAGICLLFYRGQWQFVFVPPAASQRAGMGMENWLSGSWAQRRAVEPAKPAAPADPAAIAATSGLPIQDVRFDFTNEGTARLDGWWIPSHGAASTPAPSADSSPAISSPAISSMVVLFCPDGRSDLPGNLAALRAFHALGVSVFAFDYRGFGASQPGHPSERKAYEDGRAALRYLTATRHVDPRRIVLYGAKVGAAVAVQAAERSPEIAGLILENPQPSLVKEVKREQHIHLLPMGLIFRERFDISRMVPGLKMPKLLLATTDEPEYVPGTEAIYRDAVAPKTKLRIESDATAPLYSRPEWQQAVRTFLDSLAVRTFGS